MTAPLTKVSRRELLTGLFRQPARLRSLAAQLLPNPTIPAPVAKERMALVQGRFCLAYQQSFCSVCLERCPIAGAVQTERGMPRINPDLCSGCGICHEVCPAPRNAILLVPRRKPLVEAAARMNTATEINRNQPNPTTYEHLPA